MTIKEYHEGLYTHRFHNLDEVDPFFKGHNLTKLMQEKMNNLKSPMSMNEIESTINNLPKQETPDPDEFTCEFY